MPEELKEQQKRYEETREIIADGATTLFWEKLLVLLDDVKTEAHSKLLTAKGEGVVELQQLYKAADFIITVVNSLKEEQDTIDAERLKTLKEGEDDQA